MNIFFFSNEILLLLKKALYRGLLIQNIDCGYSLYIAGTSFYNDRRQIE